MDPKATLQNQPRCTGTHPTETSRAGCRSRARLWGQSLLRPGHQSGKGTGAPFPASTTAAPASFSSDPPNYS